MTFCEETPKVINRIIEEVKYSEKIEDIINKIKNNIEIDLKKISLKELKFIYWFVQDEPDEETFKSMRKADVLIDIMASIKKD